eukprot:4281477-Pyramimonas_sp.AAC.2
MRDSYTGVCIIFVPTLNSRRVGFHGFNARRQRQPNVATELQLCESCAMTATPRKTPRPCALSFLLLSARESARFSVEG